jgi:hypothetical protein
MSNGVSARLGVQVVGVIASLALAVTAAGAGMAELGRSKNLTPAPAPEASGDPAAGNGPVALTVGNEVFRHDPANGETVASILAALAVKINTQSPQNFSASVAGAVITVVRHPSGTDVSQFGMVSMDSGFGFAEAIHQGGALFVLAACETPAGNGTVELRRNGSPIASVPTVGLSAEALNSALASAVGGQVQGTCAVSLTDPQRRRILVPGNSTRLSWEDNDTGITDIGVLNNPGGIAIPTLSEWGLLVMMTALAGLALLRLRRQRGAPAR